MRYPSPSISAVAGRSEADKNPTSGTFTASTVPSTMSFKESLHDAQNDLDKNTDSNRDDDLIAAEASLAPWAAVSQMFSERGFAASGITSPALRGEFSLNPSGANRQVESAVSSHNDGQSENQPGSNGPAAVTAENRTQKSQSTLEQTGQTPIQAAIPFMAFAPRLESPTLTRAQISEIAQSVMDKVRVIKEGETIRVEMLLQPEDLGKLALSIKMQRGVISISLLASPEAKQVLDPGIPDIVALLQKQGVSVGGFDVSTNSESSGQAADRRDMIVSVSGAPEIHEKKEAVLSFTPQNSGYILAQNFWRQNQPTVSVET